MTCYLEPHVHYCVHKNPTEDDILKQANSFFTSKRHHFLNAILQLGPSLQKAQFLLCFHKTHISESVCVDMHSYVVLHKHKHNI
jgi:hypothetical protein